MRMESRNYNDASLENVQVMASSLIEEITTAVSDLENTIEVAINSLHDYVNNRQLPKAHSNENEVEELLQMVMFVGGLIDLADGHSYLGITPKWLKHENALSTLLRKAERYICLDFPEEANWEYYSEQSGKAIYAFTLEDLAYFSGRNVGSIRNATLKGGGLETTRIENVVDKEGKKVSQSVFVEYIEAMRWLKSKYCYEELKNSDEDQNHLFEQIKKHGPCFKGSDLPDFLLLREKEDLRTYYAPFEDVNTKAKVVLCGITPGQAQAEIALNTFSTELNKGNSISEALKMVKESASFAGSMRSSLSKLLDHAGLNLFLGISSCAELFGEHKDLVHYTSALRNPVFYKGGNYTGTPSMLKDPSLKWQLDEYLANDIQEMSESTVFIPLGPKPAEALFYLAEKGFLSKDQILDGIPHPSGANAERIKYFCEEKPKEALSSRTNADAIDKARQGVYEKLKKLQSKIG